MRIALTDEQDAFRRRVREFVAGEVAAEAARVDGDGRLPDGLAGRLGANGFLDPPVAGRDGGLSNVAFGVLCEELGAACSATRSFVTVHAMVQASVARWGSDSQRAELLPALRDGTRWAAFCLTEPEAGSDTSAVALRAERVPGGYALHGEKRWVTVGERADLLLVFARLDGKPTAFLVDAGRPGVRRSPIRNPLGLRGAMQADIVFDGCVVGDDAVLGAVGAGVSIVATSALDLGRFSVAWGSVGIARACTDLAVAHGASRRQFGEQIRDHQLVRRMLTRMAAGTESARLLAYQAAFLRDEGSPQAAQATFMAKYQAARTAAEVADDAVQVHGGVGCGPDHPVQRHFRDARVMRIIEGTDEICEQVIPTFFRSGHVAHGGRC